MEHPRAVRRTPTVRVDGPCGTRASSGWWAASPVAEVLSATAIERVVVMGLPDRPDAPGDTLLDTRAFVRPQWMDGWLTLVTMPTPDGHVAPFEVPNPTPCCADH